MDPFLGSPSATAVALFARYLTPITSSEVVFQVKKNPKNQRMGEVRPCGTTGYAIQHCAELVLGSKMIVLSE